MPEVNPVFLSSVKIFADNKNLAKNYLSSSQPDIFENKASSGTQINDFYSKKNLSFLGCKVSLLDGGHHARDLKFFAKAINPNIDLEMLEVATNPKYPAAKQIKSLKEKLMQINARPEDKKPEYMAIPVICEVSLLNLSDQISAVTGKKINLTPENIKSHKESVVDFFKEISLNPDRHEKYIGYMDGSGQGFEHLHEVIKEINKAVAAGVKVFVPSGRPEYVSLKWLAGERNLKPELNNFIATGNDHNNAVNQMLSDIREKNWYSFNLLCLSDATKINVRDMEGKVHPFSAHDSFVEDGARGVFNFTPVRKDGDLFGFSFTDEKTVHYPREDYGNLPAVKNLTKYVGLPVNQVLATDAEHAEFKSSLMKSLILINNDKFANKLFRVEDIFSSAEMKEKKIKLKGDYVDCSLKLFFRTNKENKVIFPNCDCEKSGRPSVMSMAGSCFSVIQSISDRINKKFANQLFKNNEYDAAKNKALHYEIMLRNGLAEEFHNKALNIKKAQLGNNHQLLIEDYRDIGRLCEKKGNHHSAEGFYNEALRIAKLNYGQNHLKVADCYEKIAEVCNNQKKFLAAEGCYNKALRIYCYSSPTDKKIPQIFEKLGNICEKKGDILNKNVCYDSKSKIESGSVEGQKIIKNIAKEMKKS